MPITAAESGSLETARLRLGPIGPGDAAEVEAICQDWNTVRHTARIPHPYPAGEADRFIAEMVECWRMQSHYLLSARRRSDDRYIGQVGLNFSTQSEAGEAELSYLIARSVWGQGFGTEMAQACLRFGFATLGCKAIFARVVPENLASIRLVQRLGMRFQGGGVVDAPARGREVAVNCYALRRADWEGVAA